MKKYIYNSLFLTALSFFMIGCGDETTFFDADGGNTAFLFNRSSVEFGASPIDNVYNVQVGVTTRSPQARTYNVTVDTEASTLGSEGYSIDTSSLSIAPNSFNDEFQVAFNFDEIPSSGNRTLVINLTPTVGYAMPGKETITITVSRSCPLGTMSIAGTHSYFSFDLVRGQSANPNCVATPTGTVTWTNNPTAGLYGTNDFAFGMLQSCWGATGSLVGNNARVRWVCNELRPEGTDLYGDSYVYQITNVSGSEMSISWTNTWGDSGKTILTREGGADWPELFQN
jgi:hypothetical protein